MKDKKDSFARRVCAVVKLIPKGSTLSYKEVASRAGSPRAWRAVGTVIKNNRDPAVPCHRVIKSNGKAGEYNRGAERKKALLQKEGAVVVE